MNSTLNVTQAQAQLPRLIRSGQTIGISRHGSTEAFLVPRDRMEAILESLELLTNPQAMTAIARDRSGRGRYVPVSMLDENPG